MAAKTERERVAEIKIVRTGNLQELEAAVNGVLKSDERWNFTGGVRTQRSGFGLYYWVLLTRKEIIISPASVAIDPGDTSGKRGVK